MTVGLDLSYRLIAKRKPEFTTVVDNIQHLVYEVSKEPCPMTSEPEQGT